jgi:hypothetical protein
MGYEMHIYPEDGGNMLLENVGTHLPDYTPLLTDAVTTGLVTAIRENL